jgi:hypothetical protein
VEINSNVRLLIPDHTRWPVFPQCLGFSSSKSGEIECTPHGWVKKSYEIPEIELFEV